MSLHLFQQSGAAGLVQQVDFAVGKVVSALKDAGMYNNTLLVLSAE